MYFSSNFRQNPGILALSLEYFVQYQPLYRDYAERRRMIASKVWL